MSEKVYRVPVYDEDGKVIGRVKYNNALDWWNGRNWTSGSVGHHKGITKLKDGRFVIIFGSDWQGERDYARVVSREEALQAVLESGDEKLLKKYFPDYKDLEEEEIDE